MKSAKPRTGVPELKPAELMQLRIEEGELELQRQCDALKHLGARVETGIRSAFSVEMMKLPKAIRSMTLGDLATMMGTDLASLQLPGLDSIIAANSSSGQPTGPTAAHMYVWRYLTLVCWRLDAYTCTPLPTASLIHRSDQVGVPRKRPPAGDVTAIKVCNALPIVIQRRFHMHSWRASRPSPQRARAVPRVAATPATARARAAAAAAAAAGTPAGAHTVRRPGPGIPRAPMATPAGQHSRRGGAPNSAVVSVRGASMVSRVNGQQAANEPADTAVTVSLDALGEVDLSNGAGELSAEAKAEAMAKIAALQAKLASVMATLQ